MDATSTIFCQNWPETESLFKLDIPVNTADGERGDIFPFPTTFDPNPPILHDRDLVDMAAILAGVPLGDKCNSGMSYPEPSHNDHDGNCLESYLFNETCSNYCHENIRGLKRRLDDIVRPENHEELSKVEDCDSSQLKRSKRSVFVKPENSHDSNKPNSRDSSVCTEMEFDDSRSVPYDDGYWFYMDIFENAFFEDSHGLKELKSEDGNDTKISQSAENNVSKIKESDVPGLDTDDDCFNEAILDRSFLEASYDSNHSQSRESLDLEKAKAVDCYDSEKPKSGDIREVGTDRSRSDPVDEYSLYWNLLENAFLEDSHDSKKSQSRDSHYPEDEKPDVSRADHEDDLFYKCLLEKAFLEDRYDSKKSKSGDTHHLKRSKLRHAPDIKISKSEHRASKKSKARDNHLKKVKSMSDPEADLYPRCLIEKVLDKYEYIMSKKSKSKDTHDSKKSKSKDTHDSKKSKSRDSHDSKKAKSMDSHCSRESYVSSSKPPAMSVSDCKSVDVGDMPVPIPLFEITPIERQKRVGRPMRIQLLKRLTLRRVSRKRNTCCRWGCSDRWKWIRQYDVYADFK